MNNFPSKLSMTIIIALIAVFSTYRYAMKLNTKLIQNFFDWDKEVLIHSYNQLTVDSVSYNYLTIRNSISKPYNQNTFALENQSGQKYYFRFINFFQTDSTSTFSTVEWITGVPDKTDGNFTITESDIPLKIRNGKTLVTIGSDLLVKNEAKYFRRKIASELNINFEGRTKDVFNFKHEAVNSDDWTSEMTEVDLIPNAEIYIVFGDFSEQTNSELKNKTERFLEKLTNKEKNEKIIWILLPDVRNEQEKARRKKINQFILSLENPKLEILDANSIFENNEIYLMTDGIQLNKVGYETLAHEIVNMLKQL